MAMGAPRDGPPALPVTRFRCAGSSRERRGQFPINLQTLSVTEPQDITLAVSPERISLSPGGTAKEETKDERRRAATLLPFLLRSPFALSLDFALSRRKSDI
jgi:hypothetical protein